MKYKIQKIGAGILALSAIAVAFNLVLIALSLLVTTGGIDIYLVLNKEDTISNWIHDLFPKQIDAIIVIALMVFTWWVWGPSAFLPVFLGVTVGHLFWND